MKKLFATLTALLLAATAFAVTTAPAATALTGVQDLKGTWIGTYGGYEGTEKVAGGRERIVITAIHAGVAQGYWQSKQVGEKWSKKGTLHLMTSQLADRLLVSGSDLAGTYVGTLTENGELTLAYAQDSGRFLNLQISVRKQ